MSNFDVVKRAIFARNIRVVDDTTMDKIRRVAKGITDFVSKASFGFKDVTGNLRDSIGVGVYIGGVLVDMYVPTPSAKGAKTWRYKGVKYTTKGSDKLRTALNNAHRDFTPNRVVISVFAAAPYGFFVEHGLGYGNDGQIHHLGSGDATKRGYGWWSKVLIPEVQRIFKSEFGK